MTTNKPEVAAYRYTASRSFGKRNPKWHYQESFPNAENRKVEEVGRLEKLIRLSDYKALQAECDHLRKDAEIGKIVWKFIDRMNDICPQFDPADRIISEFIDKVNPIIDAALATYRKGGDV